MHTLLLLLAMNPFGRPLLDFVDRVEVNSVFNCDGSLVFDQVFFSDWNEDESRHDVVAWRILKDVRKHDAADAIRWNAEHPDGPDYLPRFIGGHATPHREPCGWVSEWLDEKCGRWRRVVARECIWTSSDYDRELAEREIMPESDRRRLSG